MQVQSTSPGHAVVVGADHTERVNTDLVGDCQPGDWVLVFLGSARERISAERAAEVQAMLALVQDSMNGQYDAATLANTGFDLPSAMGPDRLAALLGSSQNQPRKP